MKKRKKLKRIMPKVKKPVWTAWASTTGVAYTVQKSFSERMREFVKEMEYQSIRVK